MAQSIPFREGTYIIEAAYLMTPLKRSLELTEGVLEVYKDTLGTKHLRGRAFVRNTLMVALLEDEESLDLILDLGLGFRYRMPQPILQAGKVFDPRTCSIVHFAPSTGLVPLADADYEALLSAATLLLPEDSFGVHRLASDHGRSGHDAS
ncbi:hypothetical protein [Desulfosoma caldarium]|uniref:Uncharacterized protein n=1 Tax=Desulfosoma caldarium TaxID=610254 RepID=A0A3N1VIA8_9BACT|nr:hypothetical protein [Desulfosoma caldarium]ROR01769.1 hypothetical protein EDC27_0955 [Desulfosoma caldarium]